MNQITISGKSWNPEVRYTQSGVAICEVSVSIYDGKDKEGKAKYFSLKCKAFKELAENIGNEIKEGDRVVVTGKLSHESWEAEGVKKSRNVILVDSIGKEVSRFANTGNAGGASGGFDASSFGTEVDDESVPF